VVVRDGRNLDDAFIVMVVVTRTCRAVPCDGYFMFVVGCCLGADQTKLLLLHPAEERAKFHPDNIHASSTLRPLLSGS